MIYPKLSIITPSYNQGQYIRQTIDSVLGQNYPNLEYIVMDGGSTDDTLEILRSYGDRLKWISTRDEGQSDAINKGFQMATGEIMAFINSDDYYTQGVFEAVARAFMDRSCLWLTGDYRIEAQSSQWIHNAIIVYKRFLRKMSSKNMIFVMNFIAQPSTFWRRELWERIGPLDKTIHYVMDYDFWLRAYGVAPPLILDQTLSSFRIHKSSKGGSEYIRQFDEEVQVLKNYSHNRILNGIHVLHNYLIKAVYRAIK